jgi:hypothetical protein
MRMPLIRTTIGLLTRPPLLLWQLDENALSLSASHSLQIYIHIVLTTITRRRKRNAEHGQRAQGWRCTILYQLHKEEAAAAETNP